MTSSNVQSFCSISDPSGVLDWLRLLAGLLGGATCGMVAAVIWRYSGLYREQGTARQLHVVLISVSYVAMVAALVFAQLSLIGRPATPASWPVTLTMIVALPIGQAALFILLRHLSGPRKPEPNRRN